MKLSAGEKTRQKILDSVLAVIAKEGVDAITHRRVGHEAGLSHGVVSYHFPTRDELIYESFEYYYSDFEDIQTNAGWDPEKKMTKQQLVDIMTAIVAEELTNRSLILVQQEMILIAARNPEYAAHYREREKNWFEMLSKGLKRSGYKQPLQTARILFNFASGFLLECSTDPSLTEKHFKQRTNILITALSLQNE
jgi:AcrR family transcriptional regulator